MAALNKAFHKVLWWLKRIQVFALVGKPGTGKSFRSKLVASKYKIELIIDDGLLIKDNKILAGKSAKKEKIAFSAVKTALFDDPTHLSVVRTALDKENFKKILLIGTSEKMVQKIASRLGLPHIQKIIPIEDVATREEIARARRSRVTEGKHIIPVPGIEVRRNYSHIFLDSIKIFFKHRFNFGGNKEKIYEKSIVTPEFSKKGELSISEPALIQMIMHCVQDVDAKIKVKKVILKQQIYGYKIDVIISAPFGVELPPLIHELQANIIKNIENFTGISLKEVNIIIGSIS
ncbi:MAG: Asp23/Gls24 family envelope stress response protein [Spirochaetales bacterium]|nr:Asp23/Gls24 family envelope stress response protein [Spirochaetales bacterium]